MSTSFHLTLVLLSALSGPALAQSAEITPLRDDLGERSYFAACAGCHYRGAGRAPFGGRGPLAEDRPDELVQTILFGEEFEAGEGGMPAFGTVLSDADVTRIATWLRSTAKPDAPWPDLAARVAKLRASGQHDD